MSAARTLSSLVFFFAAAARANEPVLAVTAAIAASSDGSGVVTRDFVSAQLKTAEEMYAPFGVHFRLSEWRALPAAKASLMSPAERDSLAPMCAPAVINVMFVGRLRDIDAREEMYRMGVTWTGGGMRYIIVAASARASTLAHELGHFFGLQHSAVKNNLMSYERDGGPLFLDEAQKRTISGNARALVQMRALTLESWALPGAGPLTP